jgi:NADPH:quinone reductase-like Zn-dependent oxidoreductase
LKLVDIPKPVVSDGRVLVKITAAGVTPLDHTILSGDTYERKRRSSWEDRERERWRREAEKTFLSVRV